MESCLRSVVKGPNRFMKSIARYVLFVFAIIAIAGIFFQWKKQDRRAAIQELETVYSADVSAEEDSLHIGCSSEKLVDLEAFSRVVERAGDVTILDLTGSPNLESFHGVERLSSLLSLMAIDCPKLTSAKGVTGLPNLEEFFITDSRFFVDASALRDLPSLTTIDLSGAGKLEQIDVSGLERLKNLYLSRCRALKELNLSSCEKLEQLYVDGCGGLVLIDGLGYLKSLTDLDVSNCDQLQKLEGVGNLEKLVVLDIRNVNLADFSEIGTLSELKVLRLGGQDELETLEPFAGLESLTEIHLEACPKFRSLEGLPASISQYAGFTHCPSLKNLSGIGVASQIEQLDLTGCESLQDISELSSLKNLSQLNLSKCRQVTEVSSLQSVEKLAIVLLGGSGVVPGSIKELQVGMKETVFDFAVTE